MTAPLFAAHSRLAGQPRPGRARRSRNLHSPDSHGVTTVPGTNLPWRGYGAGRSSAG